jgi:hypothetical protein
MLPQVVDKGYLLHKVYQIIIKKDMSMKSSRSMFGEYCVPCTLKTESEIKSSPGFRIDIISGIWSE